MLCDYQIVPLGFFREVDGKMRYQSGSFPNEHEPMPVPDLLGEHEESRDEVTAWEKGYAALDLYTGRWHLVGAETKFGCALCQSMPYTRLDDFSLGPHGENLVTRLYRITVVTMSKAHCGTVAGNMDVVAEELYKILPHFDKIVDNVTNGPDLEFVVSAKSLKGWDLDKLQSVTVLKEFHMSVQDISTCLESVTEDAEGSGVYCIEGEIGTMCVDAVSAKRRRFTTRQCVADDATGQPTWSPPLAWQASTKPCSQLAQYASDLTFPHFTSYGAAQKQPTQLRAFLNEPQDADGIDRVADIISRELRAANGLGNKLRDDLLSIFLETDLRSFAVSRPGAQLAMSDSREKKMRLAIGLALAWDGTDPYALVGDVWAYADADADAASVDDAWTYPDVSATLVREYHHATVPRPQVALALSPGLLKPARIIAFIALWPQPETVEEPWQFGNRSSSRFLEVTVLVDAASSDVDNAGSFVDLTYRRDARSVACAVWVARSDAWDYGACERLISLSPANAACRCGVSNLETFHESSVFFRIALKSPSVEDLGAARLADEMLHSR